MKQFGPVIALAGAACLFVCAVVAGAQQSPKATKLAKPAASSWRVPAGDPVRGAQLAVTCLACHGANGGPTDPPAPKLQRQRVSYVFKALQEYRAGERKSELMQPIVQLLSDQNMRDLAVYLAGDLLDKPPRANTALPIYRRLSRDCTWCHGETGIGEFEGMPVLTGQDPKYIEHALSAYRDGTRASPIMRGVVKELPVREDGALAAYYSGYDWLEYNK